MKRASSACVVALVLGASAARADVMAPGWKGVRLSIHVDAEIPKGKTLLLANTFRGADILEPGSTVPVEWHPLGGPMQFMVIDAKDAPKIEVARAALDRDPIKKVVAQGIVCGAPFQGVRTVPETSPTNEIRWTYRVTLADATCTATLLRTEQLDKGGRSVDDPADAAPAASVEPTAQIASAAPGPAPSPSSVPHQPKVGCGACTTGRAPDRGSAWAWVLGVMALGRTARRRARR